MLIGSGVCCLCVGLGGGSGVLVGDLWFDLVGGWLGVGGVVGFFGLKFMWVFWWWGLGFVGCWVRLRCGFCCFVLVVVGVFCCLCERFVWCREF